MTDHRTRTNDVAAAAPVTLQRPAVRRERLPVRISWVVLLTLAAFLPRLWMAFQLPTICVDGVGYVETAAALERGEQGVIGSLYRLNTFPIILAGLHRLGFEWETAGKFWGVLCGTLVVPALFGWVRRQFNDPTALVACLLYAGHPELIEWSPETVRDPTFWLLFSWSIYFCYRAVDEVRLTHFVMAGLLIPACALTRFEGAFVLILLCGWAVVRLMALQEGRGRLIFGVSLSLLTAPALLTVANVVWLKHDAISDLLYLEPLKRLASLTALVGQGTVSAAGTPSVAVPEVADVRPSPFSAHVIFASLRILERGLTPFFAVLVLVGLVIHRRRFRTWEELPVIGFCVAVIGGIWIHQWYCQGGSSRYCLSLVILGTRPAAMAVHSLGLMLQARFAGLVATPRAAALVVAVYSIVGWCDAISSQYNSRVIKAELGRWIHDTYGNDCRLVGADDQLPLVRFYAQCSTTQLSATSDKVQLTGEVRNAVPDVLLLSHPPISTEAYDLLHEEGLRIGLVPTTPDMPVRLRSESVVLSRPLTRR